MIVVVFMEHLRVAFNGSVVFCYYKVSANMNKLCNYLKIIKITQMSTLQLPAVIVLNLNRPLGGI